jgi:hypothetical protein
MRASNTFAASQRSNLRPIQRYTQRGQALNHLLSALKAILLEVLEALLEIRMARVDKIAEHIDFLFIPARAKFNTGNNRNLIARCQLRRGNTRCGIVVGDGNHTQFEVDCQPNQFFRCKLPV